MKVGCSRVAAICGLVLWIVTGLAAAQEQVGGIAGRITDTDGAALPGATVTLTGAGLGELSALTDAQGS